MVTPNPVAQFLPFFMGADTVSVITTKSVIWLVQNGNKSFIAQSLLFAVLNLYTSPLWASVRRTAAKFLHRTCKQPLLLSFLNEPLFEQVFDASPDLRKNPSAVRASARCRAIRHEDAERVAITNVLAAASSPPGEGTESLDEEWTGSVFSVSLAFLPPSGLDTIGITPSHSKVYSFLVAFQLEASSVLVQNVPLATLSTVSLPSLSSSCSDKPT